MDKKAEGNTGNEKKANTWALGLGTGDLTLKAIGKPN
jgi:hypothetical protein